MITTSVFGANLGDTLWVTPLACYVPDLVVEMRKGDPRAEATATILDGVARVVFVDNPMETPKARIQQHVTQQILAFEELGGKPSIPRVVLRAEEINVAIERLRPYGPKVITFVNQNSGCADPFNRRAHYVRPPVAVMESLSRFWQAAGYTVIQFGPPEGFYPADRDPFTPLPGATIIRGLSVREMAACYHVIGRLISGDTGDYHLMLAVGGKVACLVPEHSDSMGYRHWDLLYDDVCWGGEKPRCVYALHEDWDAFMDTSLFKNL